MLIKNSLLLYHGSYAIVNDIDIKRSAEGKDFGKGFYVTKNRQQAKQFIDTSLLKAKSKGLIKTNQNYGYINIYKFEMNDKLNIYEFEKANDEWLWYIAKNRKESLAKELSKFIDKKVNKADIIIGKIANDTTNPMITTYLNGLYGNVTSKETMNYVINMLLPNKLDYQYCFKTRKAISCLQFVEAKRYEV